ncbi:DNA repair protein RadC [Sporolactobacillus sp. THM7-7]|mgnify:CR=1 FL=1|jgi:DNA repair protein RadC|nr:DNA repair protein RadC [Sporolactobacillus sp. THM7-7]
MEKIYEIQRIKQIRIKSSKDSMRITSPSDAAEVARFFLEDEDREVFLVIVLNTKNEVIAVHRCHIGLLNASLVHPREVFKSALLNNGYSIICAHNHPSGNPVSSREDMDITKRLFDSGNILGVTLLDHIIIANNSDEYYSLKQHHQI